MFSDDDDRHSVVRKESDKDFQELRKEIGFLCSLNKEQGRHFAEVREYELSGDTIYYTMPYYEKVTLRDLLFKEIFDQNIFHTYINNILIFLVENIYSSNVSYEPSKDLIVEQHLNRVRDRLRAMVSVNETFSRMVTAEEIMINDRRYRNVLSCINRIEETDKLISRLVPTKTHMVHGDLHFDNILIDQYDVDGNDFILLDPRGERCGYDVAYDLGKLWHSAHGKYDLLHEGCFSIDYRYERGKFVIEFLLDSCKYLQNLELINQRMHSTVESVDALNEEDWFVKTCFSEAAHFCAVSPFHFNNNTDFVVARYAIGVILLNTILCSFDQISPEIWNDTLSTSIYR